MKLALHVSDFKPMGGPEGIAPTVAEMARAADETGFHTLTLMDHWFQMEQPETDASDPMLEGYTTLGYLAATTHRLVLGLLVTGVTYRHPGLLAKIITTLDVLSNGRAQLGIGAAWYEREHLGLGVPFPPVAERFERLEETLQICKQMWSDNDGPFDGRHYQLAETLCRPRPLQPRGPRIMIGGMGEKKTLRLVAQYADACNLFAGDPELIKHKIEVLHQHCETVGRDPGEVEKTIIGGADPMEDVDAFLSTMETYAALGVTKVWVGAPWGHEDPAGWVRRAGETLVERLETV